ncbi:MAG: hypothetical protein QXE05_09820 [Nitrososphaeria archaeon]
MSMRYIQFPNLTITNPAGQSYAGVLYENVTTSFVRIMGLPRPVLTGSITPSAPYWFAYYYYIQDLNSNVIDTVDQFLYQLNAYTGDITVWNGTSMETEPATFPALSSVYLSRKNSIMPPQSRLTVTIAGSASNTMTFSGWGIVLTDEEMKEVVVTKDD